MDCQLVRNLDRMVGVDIDIKLAPKIQLLEYGIAPHWSYTVHFTGMTDLSMPSDCRTTKLLVPAVTAA